MKGSDTDFYFCKGTDSCIYVFTPEIISQKLEKLDSVKLSDKEKQKALRVFTKALTLVESDVQGRMIVPQPLVEYAKIDKDIVICGSNDRIEIWAKAVYEDYFAGSDENFDNLLAELDM